MSSAADHVRALMGRTEHLAAFDEAEQALAAHPDDAHLLHLAILALARSGATDTADARLRASGLVGRVDHMDVALAEDVLALDARIAKDRALAAPLADRARLSTIAAERYEAVFDRYRRTYTGVNAATMWCVAGDLDRSRSLAADVLALLPAHDGYWTEATRGEALLLCGEVDRAAASLRAAHAAADGDIAARASTRRQLALVCDVLTLDPVVIEALPVPVVLHYCGHLPAGAPGGAGRLRGPDEQRVAREITSLIARCGTVIAHGSLAAGADIVIAEAVLASGGELHAVLPFPADEFEVTSVQDAGEHWVARFLRCLERASTVTVVTGGRQGDDDAAYAYCSSIAMGAAVVRAQHLASRAEQLAVWDGVDTGRGAGTAADIKRWRSTGLPSTVVPVRSSGTPSAAVQSAPSARVVRALLFGDVKGFSAMRDHHIPAFVNGVLSPLARVLDEADVPYRNGWGDAIYAVVDDVGAAAELALRLQETFAAIDHAALGLPPIGLRIGAHAGPVFAMHDPIRAEPSFFGEHVIRAARIEPVAPPGAVFATDGFAALLALDAPDGYVCEYVGRLPTAKGFGSLPMHLVRRRHSPTTA